MTYFTCFSYKNFVLSFSSLIILIFDVYLKQLVLRKYEAPVYIFIISAVVVTQNATVLDLKHAIKRHFLLKQSREGGTTHLSW